MTPKIDILRGHMAAGRWPEAIKLAASFPRLGEEKAAILKGREALLRPDFQRQLGRDVPAMVEGAKAALRRRYGGN